MFLCCFKIFVEILFVYNLNLIKKNKKTFFIKYKKQEELETNYKSYICLQLENTN